MPGIICSYGMMSSSAFSNRQIRNTPITLPQLSPHGRWCNVMCSGLHISAVTYTAKLLLSQGNAIAKVRSLIMNLNIKKQNCPFPWRDPSPNLIRDSLGPLNSLFQTACQLGQSYFCSSPETMHILYNGAGHAPPPKLPILVGSLGSPESKARMASRLF